MKVQQGECFLSADKNLYKTKNEAIAASVTERFRYWFPRHEPPGMTYQELVRLHKFLGTMLYDEETTGQELPGE